MTSLKIAQNYLMLHKIGICSTNAWNCFICFPCNNI